MVHACWISALSGSGSITFQCQQAEEACFIRGGKFEMKVYAKTFAIGKAKAPATIHVQYTEARRQCTVHITMKRVTNGWRL
jgi:hypothetical protein